MILGIRKAMGSKTMITINGNRWVIFRCGLVFFNPKTWTWMRIFIMNMATNSGGLTEND
jgi:hypothetical protein